MAKNKCLFGPKVMQELGQRIRVTRTRRTTRPTVLRENGNQLIEDQQLPCTTEETAQMLRTIDRIRCQALLTKCVRFFQIRSFLAKARPRSSNLSLLFSLLSLSSCFLTLYLISFSLTSIPLSNFIPFFLSPTRDRFVLLYVPRGKSLNYARQGKRRQGKASNLNKVNGRKCSSTNCETVEGFKPISLQDYQGCCWKFPSFIDSSDIMARHRYIKTSFLCFRFSHRSYFPSSTRRRRYTLSKSLKQNP